MTSFRWLWLLVACSPVVVIGSTLEGELLARGVDEEPGDAAAAAPPPAAKDVFDLLDSNHDGRMDRAEFQQAVDQFEDFLRHKPEATGWFARQKAVHKALPFWNGFTSAVGLILATEIGDKTFFIAAVLSMKQDRRAVFGGAILALVLMTILSTIMGLILPQFLDRKYTHLLAGVLFGYFGLLLLYQSQGMASHKVSEELDEVEEELLHTRGKKLETADSTVSAGESTEDNSAVAVDPENPMRNRGPSMNSPAPKSPKKKQPRKKASASRRQSALAILVQSFSLTFVAEWGDRSQIATIALAAAKNPYGVTLGGCVGHSMCTGLAVLGGRMLAARISEKTVSQYGGALFLLFGIHSLFFES